MPTSEEQMQLEWRAIVLDKLKNLETGQASLQKDLGNLSNSYASVTDVHDLRSELEQLKLYKARVTGIIVALNTVAAVVGWLIQSFLHK